MLRATPGRVCIKLTTMGQLEKKALPRGRRKRGDGIKQSLRALALVISGQQLTSCLPTQEFNPLCRSCRRRKFTNAITARFEVVSMCWHCGCHTKITRRFGD